VNYHLAEITDGRRRATGDRGAALVEYLLLVSLIAVVCIAAVTFLGDGVSSSVDSSASAVVTATGG
jgi:Flp pilus assembly pilin Flp